MKKTKPTRDGETVLLDLEVIKNNPLNPRTGKNPRYNDIVESIRVLGCNTTPIEVYPDPSEKGKYTTLSGGGTRLLALRELEKPKALCIIRKDPKDEGVVLAAHLRENMVRGETTFPDSARGINKVLAKVLAESPNAPMKDLVEYLNDKGLAVAKTTLSLYLKADYLFAGWCFYDMLTKRTVEYASAQWESTRKVIGEYDKKLSRNSVELRRIFITPGIERHNEVVGKSFSVLRVANTEAFDSDREPTTNMAMELRLLMEGITKKVSGHFAQQEQSENGGEVTPTAVVMSAIQTAQRGGIAESETDSNDTPGQEEDNAAGDNEDYYHGESFRGRARRAMQERQQSEEVSEAEDAAMTEAQQAQEAENKLRRITAMRFRGSVNAAVTAAKETLQKRTKSVKIEIPADLALSIYDRMVSPIEFQAGSQVRTFVTDGDGRLHRLLSGHRLNLSAMFERAKTEAEAEMRGEDADGESATTETDAETG